MTTAQSRTAVLWLLLAGALLMSACAASPGAAPEVTVQADPRVIDILYVGRPGEDFERVSDITLARTARAVLERNYRFFDIVHSASEEIPPNDPRYPSSLKGQRNGLFVMRTTPQPIKQRYGNVRQGQQSIFAAEVTIKMYTLREALRYDLALVDAKALLIEKASGAEG